jgi:two-component system, sporulation sensor kinase A
MNSSIEYDKKLMLENRIAEDMKAKYDFDAVYAMNIEGIFVRLNRLCEHLFGYDSEQLSGKSLSDVVKSTSLERAISYFSEAQEGKYQNFDCQIIHKNGNLIEVNIINFPILLDGEIAGVYGIVKDITEIKLKRQKVKETEALYQLLTEHSLDMITKASVEGELLYVSPYCFELLGYTSEELIGISANELIHEADLEKVLRNRAMVGSLHKHGRVSFRMKHKKEHYIWVESLCNSIINENSGLTEIISVTRDISERKKAEDDILQKEEIYRGIVEHSPDAIVLANHEQILFANDTAVHILGANDKNQLIGRNPFDFIGTDYYQAANQRIMEVEKGKAVDFMEVNLVRFDGQKVEVEVKTIPTIFQNMPARHSIIRDITGKKKTQELLLNSEKLSVAGQLAAGIAHEVRNPLTAIKGFLQLMNANAEYQKNYFDIINAEINRIELILSELLLLSKPQDMKFKLANLKDIVRHVKALIDTHANMNNIQVELNYLSDIQKFICDENQLKQVFINFLKNSIESMPKGGKIIINVTTEESSSIKIQFIDQGSGIPKEHLARIGQPFFTTKENGTGLGLMISMKIIENHKGKINILSSKKGTTIEVTLPAHQ